MNPIKTITLPEYKEIDITDQLKLVVMERKNIPSFTFRLTIWGGASNDITGKEGLHRLTGRLLKKGAGDLDAVKFSEAVESLGGSIGVRTNYDYMAVIGDFLSKDIDRALYLLADMILTPRFRKTEIELSRKNAIGDIKAIMDNPSNLCSILHNKNVFGKHPYGRMIIGNPISINSITQADIKKNYINSIMQSKMLLTIVGDVRTQMVADRIKTLFGDLNRPDPYTFCPPKPRKINSRRIYLTNKSQQTQTHLRIGAPGIKRNDPEYHGLMVANTYFGGSFTSRLMTEIRVNRGLTYGIRSAISAYMQPGHLSVITFTKNETAVESVRLIFNEIKRMQERKITRLELDNTKKYITGLYPLSLETNKKIANKLSDTILFDLPEDNISDFREKIMEVSSEEVREVSRRKYSAENVIVTGLGDINDDISGFKKIGNVVNKQLNYYFR